MNRFANIGKAYAKVPDEEAQPVAPAVPMTREQWEAHRRSRGSYFVSYQHYLDAERATAGGAK